MLKNIVHFSHISLVRVMGLLTLSLLVTCCKDDDSVSVSYITPEKAAHYFALIEESCNNDNGKLLGENLYGPLMLIDRSTRIAYTNVQDDDHLLRERSGVYVGSLPNDVIVNNESVVYGSTKYAVLLLSREENEYRTVTYGIRNLFFVFLAEKGYQPPLFYNTTNMDAKNARIWLKLEWNALRKALITDGDEKLLAIRDALIFRGSNHELYSKYVNDEILNESYEGLATFTYLMLSSNYPNDYFDRLFNLLDRVYSFRSFARSYGSVHGALYATLAYQKGFDFSTVLTKPTDLGKVVQDLYDIELPLYCRDVAGSIALNYDLETIRQEEADRDRELRNRMEMNMKLFLEEPVIIIDLESPYYDYEDSETESAGTLGTIYSNIHISDNWGKLTLDNANCLISYNFKQIRIPATSSFKQEKSHLYGNGWSLNLNNGWEVEVIYQDYYVRKTR